MPPKRKSIVFNREKDTFLCREVLTVNPFQNYNSWNEIADKITNKYELTKPCTKRTVADRVQLLLGNWKKSENASKKKSGENESYTEWESLMIDMTALKDEQEYEQQKQVDQRQQKSEVMDKGKKMRDQAMFGMKKRKREYFSSSDEHSEYDDIQLAEMDKFLPNEEGNAPQYVQEDLEAVSDLPEETFELTVGYDITNRPKNASAAEKKTSSKENQKNQKKKQKKENISDPFLELMARKLDLDEAREKRLEREREKNEEFQNRLLYYIMNQKKE
ncbi:hypothetical protein SNE40_022497 [Patella caerulea]|uniref:Uncharacterized protein n=1 Tax=Patella caerulea TaxID=87958 RepID=A0AAN8FWR0_PATCE